MPKDVTPGKPTTRRYSPEEQAAAVRMVRTLRAELGTDAGTIQRVARQLGYGTASLRLWVNQADGDDGDRPGVSTDETARVKALEQEVRELRRANEILKRASTFSGGGARPPTHVIVDFIDANRGDVVEGRKLGVEPICRVLQVAPSLHYAAKTRPTSARSQRDCGKQPGVPVMRSGVTRSPA